MATPEPTGPGERSWEERTRSTSSLFQIESHEWSAAAWERSERWLAEIEANLSLARGRLAYERFLRSGPGGYPMPGASGDAAMPHFRRAAELFRALGDDRGEREALFWVGTLEQVLHQDFPAAREALERSRDLCATTDLLVLSCVERHLGFVALLTGDPEGASRHLEESVRLRRELRFWPGVALGLVALAEAALERRDVAEARRRLDEAGTLAREHGAAGALAAVGVARAELERAAAEPAVPD